MTKQEKIELVDQLTETLKENPNVYVADGGGLTVAQVNELRGQCFKAGIKMQVVKNTLLIKAMDASAGNYEGIYDSLKGQSQVYFVGENVNAPAKVIQAFRKGKSLPVFKSAYIDEAIFVGDENLKVLSDLKSKNELIGEIVGLLQSPMKNVIGALKSGGNTIAGLVKTLSERKE